MASPEAWLRMAIEGVAGCNAYPLVVNEGQAPPFVVYMRTATARVQQLDGAFDSPVGTFEITIYNDGYLAVKTTADAVRAAVNNFQGPGEGANILSVQLDNERDADPVFLEGRDLPTFVVEQTYTIRWEE
jgi:hypothetical protein